MSLPLAVSSLSWEHGLQVCQVIFLLEELLLRIWNPWREILSHRKVSLFRSCLKQLAHDVASSHRCVRLWCASGTRWCPGNQDGQFGSIFIGIAIGSSDRLHDRLAGFNICPVEPGPWFLLPISTPSMEPLCPYQLHSVHGLWSA